MNFFKDKNLKDSSLPTYVFVHNLNWLSVFPLIKIFLKRGSFFVYYYDLSTQGLRLISLLRLLGIVVQEPVRIKDIMKMDLPGGSIWNVRHQAFRACSDHLENIKNIIKKCFPFIKSSEINFYSVNVRKAWEAWLAPLLLLRRTGKYFVFEQGLPLQQVVVVSPFASLIRILKFDSNFVGEIELINQPFGNKALIYLLGAFWISFWRLVRKCFYLFLKFTRFPSPINKESHNVGIEAAWDLASPSQPNEVFLDDLFWWRKSTILQENIKYFYNRKKIQPTAERLKKTEALGIESIGLDSKFCKDTPELLLEKQEPHKTLGHLLKDFLFSGRLFFCKIFSEEQTLSVVSLIQWYYIKSEGLSDIFKSLKIRAIFFYNEGGFDLFSLAAKSADAIRIGFQWTSLLGIEGNVTARSHDVFFFWGQHDIKLALDSGCTSKHMLLSGCFFNGTSNEQTRDKVESLAEEFRQRGVNYVITLLGTSGATPRFYQFFARWLVKDPKLGLLIKDKSFSNWDDLTGLQANHSLDESFGEVLYKAQDTQRIHLLSREISPADAALSADFSVGIGSISSTTVAALQGAKVFFVDYERLDEGPQKPYTTFHSLGPNRCIFYDLETLKQAVLNYAANPEGNPNLGDASPILNRLDAFRDQEASRRIGEYVEWYLEALDLGLARDEATLFATKKYAEKWGEDKVVRGL